MPLSGRTHKPDERTPPEPVLDRFETDTERLTLPSTHPMPADPRARRASSCAGVALRVLGRPGRVSPCAAVRRPRCPGAGGIVMSTGCAPLNSGTGTLSEAHNSGGRPSPMGSTHTLGGAYPRRPGLKPQ